MENTALIKRYPNRKLYDTTNSKYVTLVEIKDRMQKGEEFTCVNSKTREDITNNLLMSVLSTKSFSLETLKKLIVVG